jgi:2-keto-3-deoxy-L-rhamnonate aldolase RhmA
MKERKIKMEDKDFENIKAVMNANVDSLMSIEGVVGVAIGALDDKSLCIKVMVKKDEPELNKQIPDQLENYPVVMEETGVIRAFSTEK